ncbi:UNKNOWN [Stylonychia lemnae]|uniref:Uncharacterized protein n=1 Tax=Stylonychia lemnae TaxID=5949 RepID=A0A078AMZ6_STYLE|nr:UNKNOWN [Stylonychia lemnae]|eukprot:CDW82263.1 UNKNOWN [Stylonychia lemnae]
MLRQELFPYLDDQDVIKLLQTSKLIGQVISEHFSIWKNHAYLIANKLQIDFDELLQFNTFQNYKEAQKLSKVNNTFHTYRRFFEGKNENLAYAGGMWSCKGDKRYYQIEDRNDSTFGFKVTYMKTVCKFDPWAVVQRVIPGIYDLFIIHGVKNSPSDRQGIMQQATLFVEKKENETRTELYKKQRFIPREICLTMPQNQLVRTLICRLDLTKNQSECTIILRLFDDGGNWKSDYLFEGFALVQVKPEKVADSIPKQNA